MNGKLKLTYQTTNKYGFYGGPNIRLVPRILSLSSLVSICGTVTQITIFGENFKAYSTVHLGTFAPLTNFINSTQINFHVPINAPIGNYPVYISHDNLSSNAILFTVDSPTGYWTLNADTSVISNTNENGMNLFGNIHIGPIQNDHTLTIQTNTLLKSNITFHGNVTHIADERNRENMEELNSSYIVDNITPVKYKNTQSNKIEIGFLAHEIQKEYPYLVDYSSGYQSIQYTSFLGILVNEIKMLKGEIKQLKEQIQTITKD
jgi:hypothetical protein